MTDTEIEAVVRDLTKANQEAVLLLDGEWEAGPYLNIDTISSLQRLRDLGLVEREFLDMGPPRHTQTPDTIMFELAACWHFRLTANGLAVRARLAKERDDGQG
jgi:hypothetical protein